MKTLYLTLYTNRNLVILPDSQAHLNGHTVITKSYSIFKDSGVNHPDNIESKRNEELLEPLNDPDYLGILRFDVPDKLFTYTSGNTSLETEEVSELIELLSGIRENPAHWR
jgi:hypothetical protein